MITKATFVGDTFTRKAPKYERFIRPTGSYTLIPRFVVYLIACLLMRRFTCEESSYHSSRAENDILSRYFEREEESVVVIVYKSRCSH